MLFLTKVLRLPKAAWRDLFLPPGKTRTSNIWSSDYWTQDFPHSLPLEDRVLKTKVWLYNVTTVHSGRSVFQNYLTETMNSLLKVCWSLTSCCKSVWVSACVCVHNMWLQQETMCVTRLISPHSMLQLLLDWLSRSRDTGEKEDHVRLSDIVCCSEAVELLESLKVL